LTGDIHKEILIAQLNENSFFGYQELISKARR